MASHLHMIALAEFAPDAERLSRDWHEITGDSFIVDVRPISQDDPASGFVEVFKYAVKFSDQEPADTVHAWETLAGETAARLGWVLPWRGDSRGSDR